MSTGIEWTDETWNPVVGCKAVSPGCDNCYAAREASGRLRGVPVYAGLAEGGVFTGEVRCLPERLDQPLKWKRPRRVFVNSMSDLFHPDVLKAGHEGQPFLAHVVARMVAAERHTFQVLTKRPHAMAAVLRNQRFKLDVNSILLNLGHEVMPGGMSEPNTPWPDNIWWGTSIESDRYIWRADRLRDVPTPTRFLSCEPLLGSLRSIDLERIDWVIVGGESGPKARPMHPAWPREIRDACTLLEIPFLFKQWGEWAPLGIGDHYRGAETYLSAGGEHLGVNDSGITRMARLGKKAAGRQLDGRTWDEYPG